MEGKSTVFGCKDDCSGFKGDLIIPSAEQQIQLNSSSKGNQRKWYVDGKYVKEQFFYQGKYWKDNYVEVIASTIAEQIQDLSPVVEQHLCKIRFNGCVTEGCYSDNFCKNNERFLSFKRLCDLKDISICDSSDCVEKYHWCLSVLNSVDIDFTNYLQSMILLDYLVGNEDRHYNNFGLIATPTGYSVAPLFDFGLGLFEHDLCYAGVPFRECLSMMQSKPFSRDNQVIMNYVLDHGAADLLPERLDLTGVVIPSQKAGSYLLNRCKILGIKLEGVS